MRPLATFSRFVGIAFVLLLSACASSRALPPQPAGPIPEALRLPQVFTDHAVLQRDVDLPVWGWDHPSQKVVVRFGGDERETLADELGRWRVNLPPQNKSTTPQDLVVEGSSQITVSDLLVGDVWLCSGQSNMEYQLRGSIGGPEAALQSDDPGLRLLLTHWKSTPEPAADLENAAWSIANPQTTPIFSAVAYYFGRNLRHTDPSVPIGLIQACWGGSRAEAWTAPADLRRVPRYATELDSYLDALKLAPLTPEEIQAFYDDWTEKTFPPSPADRGLSAGWQEPGFDDSDWAKMTLPGFWEEIGLQFDGMVWFRRNIDIPSDWQGKPLLVRVGSVDDQETVWFNGQYLGERRRIGEGWFGVPRDYPVEASAVHAGDNELTIRVFDSWGYGGIGGDANSITIRPADSPTTAAISLAGEWRFAEEFTVPPLPGPPPTPRVGPSDRDAPGNLYNGMIAPLVPFRIAGALWYQGESNTARAGEYAGLLELMIRGWRRAWGQGNFPFFIVQIAPYEGGGGVQDTTSALLREAQVQIVRDLPRTAIVVTTDCGDAHDIHPRQKVPVGNRLARAARAIVWGEKITPMSPIFRSAHRRGEAMEVRFDYIDGGLELRDDRSTEFWIAGADRIFHPALAHVEGQRLLVESPEVLKPEAVRFGWNSVPGAPLVTTEGLPVSPFRTDNWPDESIRWVRGE